MGNRPARCPCQKAKAFLQLQIIDFVNNAVNIVWQIGPILHKRFKTVQKFLLITAYFIVRINRKAELFDVFKKFNLAFPTNFGNLTPSIDQKAEPPFFRNARIQLAQ